MKVEVEGHRYELANFDDPNSKGQILQFIHKENIDGTTDLKLVSDGTTNEEVLEVLINRITFLQAKFPCKENACCITHLQEGLMWLEKRTRDRIKRQVEGKHIA